MSKEKMIKAMEKMPSKCKYEGKYIREDDVINLIESKCIGDGWGTDDDYFIGAHGLTDEVGDLPAADVEPVRKWISVDKQLPEEFRDVLVWYEYNGLYQTCGVGYQSDGIWNGMFNGKNQKVIAWMYFPEPPKMDGGSRE